MKKITITILILIALIGTIANASPVYFVDAVGLGNGQLKISAPDNTPISALNSSESFNLVNNTAYILDYQTAGLIQVKDESLYGLEGLRFLIAYFLIPLNFQNLIIFALGLILLLLGVMGKL